MGRPAPTTSAGAAQDVAREDATAAGSDGPAALSAPTSEAAASASAPAADADQAKLDVADPAHVEPIDLFSRAKFSQHVVDVGMKEEAIAALEQVRDQLREGTPVEEAPDAEAVAPGQAREA